MAPDPVLKVRKLADKSEGERVKRFDPVTGEAYLMNPATEEAEAWPLAGIEFVNLPKRCKVGTGFVDNGIAEGWIEIADEQYEYALGGPPEAPNRVVHAFRTGTSLTIHGVDGDAVYTILANPGKYDDDTEPSGKRVDWFYDLKLEA